MKTTIPEEVIFRLADASKGTLLYTYAADAVARSFRSMHYVSSELVCNAVILNVTLNKEITPASADSIITILRRRTRSLYTTIDSAFFPIEDRFDEYAASVLGDEYQHIRSLNMRKTNYIVYVISRELVLTRRFDRRELFYKAYTYAELESVQKYL